MIINGEPPKPVRQLSEHELRSRTRRSFLTMAVAGVGGYGVYRWIKSRPPVGEAPWPLRGGLRANERITGAYFNGKRQAPVFAKNEITPEARVNGDVGLGEDFNPARWQLLVHPLNASKPSAVGMEEIRALPRHEHVTQLKCIEGWSMVVHWAGARLADFTARYAPGSESARYVSMVTPDQTYFVGLDMPSALHPQTLLCYEMNGEPLTLEHGAPLRLVIPVKYGIKNIKRIGSIRYTDIRPKDYWAEEGYDWYAGM